MTVKREPIGITNSYIASVVSLAKITQPQMLMEVAVQTATSPTAGTLSVTLSYLLQFCPAIRDKQRSIKT